MKLKTNKDVQLDEPIYTGIVFEWATRIPINKLYNTIENGIRICHTTQNKKKASYINKNKIELVRSKNVKNAKLIKL